MLGIIIIIIRNNNNNNHNKNKKKDAIKGVEHAGLCRNGI